MEKSVWISGATAEGMARLRAEVEALPLKKQEKWHTCGCSIDGTRRRIRFRGGHFQIKVLANTTKGESLLPVNGWAPMVAIGENAEPSQIVETYGKGISPHMVNLQPERLRPQMKQILQAYECGGPDACNAEGFRMMLHNYTGRHHRNKHVSIPVAPGQPLRG